MFNVTKAIKGLEETMPVDAEEPLRALDLYRVLLAGQEDEVEELDHWGYRLKIANMNKRLQKLESEKGELIGRIKRLEEHKHDNADGAINMKEPSKPTELNKACEEFYKGDGWKPLQSKAEGKTPDYLMEIEGKTPDYLTGGKPEKPVT